MPQLQEGDEIVHINGRTVKDLPHREVFFFFGTRPHLSPLAKIVDSPPNSERSDFFRVSHSQHPN